MRRRETRKVCNLNRLMQTGLFNRRNFLSHFLCRKSEFPTKRSVRPFSQYAYDIKLKNALTERENFGFAGDENKIDNKTLVNGGHMAQTWYRDVVELRKKAEEYKVRRRV